MRGYEVQEHTGDVGLVATGSSFAEALTCLAKGMFSLIADPTTMDPRETLEVAVASADAESLVVDWLNELIFRYETDGFLPVCFDVDVADEGTRLSAVCRGDRADPTRHSFGTQVKAATFHGLKIDRGDGWRLHVVLDV